MTSSMTSRSHREDVQEHMPRATENDDGFVVARSACVQLVGYIVYTAAATAAATLLADIQEAALGWLAGCVADQAAQHGAQSMRRRADPTHCRPGGPGAVSACADIHST